MPHPDPPLQMRTFQQRMGPPAPRPDLPDPQHMSAVRHTLLDHDCGAPAYSRLQSDYNCTGKCNCYEILHDDADDLMYVEKTAILARKENKPGWNQYEITI